ncbi:MAG: nitronate monooxygenase [Gemmatimonadaceae bacterium]
MSSLPQVIQGGMGVAVSGWRLANAVSRAGQLGVVSGTAIDTVMVRRLQDGDPGGHTRRALARFPIPEVGDEIVRRYFRDDRPEGTPYKLLPMYKQAVTAARQRVTMAASFVEVWLAKEGHSGAVGLNLLTKVQMPNLATLYGAMLAGVDFVLMGAGIPREIPGALDALAQHQPAQLRFEVEGAPRDAIELLTFDPSDHWQSSVSLQRPRFLAIVSASSLATTLARKANGRVDGFIVEAPTAGGHNAPPRGELQLNGRREPVYGARDAVDLAKMRELGLPFWLAGGVGSPEGLRRALDAGAAGIQVGTLFALCEESGIDPALRKLIVSAAKAGNVDVFTDPRASPTGYPFKTVSFGDGTDIQPRERVCDLGYLRVAVRSAEGRLMYRCAAEPVADFVRKGGSAEDAEGRRCLCNGLAATVGMAQVRENGLEPPIITSGDDLPILGALVGSWAGVHAERVLQYLLGE